MPEGLYPHIVLIVTGSVPRAEQMDRPLAYYLKDEIDKRGGRDPRRRAIVVSDLWYLRHEDVHGQPTVSVGGTAVNALSAVLYRVLPVAMTVEDVLVIQMDVGFKDLRAAVWGRDHENTRAAVATFALDRFLGRFLEAAWSRTPSES